MSPPGPPSGSRSYFVSSRSKGKQRARDEGSGGSDGMLLSLDLVGDGMYDAVYTVPVLVGTEKQQNLSLQVDTGSSDLWIASSSCSSSACSQTKGHTYDPSGAVSTGDQFNINYLQGNVSGPIVWDTVQVGSYSVDNQALAAATQVDSEPLDPNFSGILGLALPLDSIIASSIPPVTNNSPDGAAFASNLFSITPASDAPSARYISLSLSRPGSDRVPSLLGIGRHPTELVSDPSKIKYSTLVSESSGVHFWKVDVRAITVYVGGQARPVNIGRSTTGAVFPTAVLDSGVPYILTTAVIANGIYGAIGIDPAADGQYYVPCTTPLNMTITIDGIPEISLHPLDVTAYPPTDPAAQNCIGLIQNADAQLRNPASDIGDMILGVPFLRNTYTVMAYTPPDVNGNFASDDIPDAVSMSSGITPRLGLLGLTDPTTALDEFQRVRVLNQPLSSGQSSGSQNGGAPVTTGDKKMSVGIDVLIGLVSFVGLCVTLFGLRWFLARRRFAAASGRRTPEVGAGDDKAQYELARRGSHSSVNGPSEDTLRTLRYEAYQKKERLHSQYTASSGRTEVALGDDAGEFAVRKYGKSDDQTWDPYASIGLRDTLVGDQHDAPTPPLPLPVPVDDELPASTHKRTPSELSGAAPALSLPLLAHTRSDSRADDLAEFGLTSNSSMAGVGTASRSSRIDPTFRHSRYSVGSFGSRESRREDSRSRSRSPRPRTLVVAPPLVEEDVKVDRSVSAESDIGHGT